MPAIEGVGVAERAIAPLTLDNAPKITPKTVDNSGGGQAAVIVSLSSAATSAAVGSNLGEISANKVVNVLSSAVGANGFAENYRRFDFSRIEKYSVRQLQIATGMEPV